MKSVFFWLTLIGLLAALCLTASSQPVLAGAPVSGAGAPQVGTPPILPRHRVGHLAKTRNLDVLLAEAQAQGAATDPLAGNYRLAEDDEIFVTAPAATGASIQWQAYDVDSNLDAPTLITAASEGTGDKSSAATGNFTGDALADFVVAWTNNNKVQMDVGYLEEGLHNVHYAFDTGEQAFAYAPQVATGDFDGDGQDEIIMAWLGGGSWVNLKVYDPQGGIRPVAKVKLYDEQLANGDLDVATGDFDGDGTAEVVLAWTDMGNWTAVKVYDVNAQGNLIAKAKWRATNSSGPVNTVATADFNSDGRDEIAAGDGNDLRILQVAQDLSSLTAKSDQGWGCNRSSGGSAYVAVGDFNTDGVDEIVYTCHGGNYIEISVFASGSDLGLSRKAFWSKSVNYTKEGSLAVGDLNRDLRAEIVVGWAQENRNDQWPNPTPTPPAQENYVQVLQVAGDLGSITAKGQRDLGAAPPQTGITLVVGDLNADSVRVGAPTYSNVVQALKPVAVINEPPKHYDVIGGTPNDVNNNTNTYARYENVQKTSTTMGTTVTRDWGISSEVSHSFFDLIDVSLGASYGQGFEKTTSSFRTTEFGQNATAQNDDGILRSETEYDVWEYPVYADASDLVQGHIMVVFPRKVDPACSSNCEATQIVYIDGKNPVSAYTPNHENHNALSYPLQAPSDISGTIKVGTAVYLGTNPFEEWVSWSDVEDSSTKKSSHLDLDASVELPGFKASGTYSQGQVSTLEVNFETDTSIHVHFDSISDARYSYRVTPYFYWAKPDGHLVLDYAVQPVTATPATWWQNTYNKPDPAFNLPWKYNDPPDAYSLLTKEITFDPLSPTTGQPVTVTAKVRNYSLVGANNVVVRFYNGDPDAGGVQFSQHTITQLNPQSAASVVATFNTSGYANKLLNIYARIDPNTPVAEMHTDNNKAYAILPVKAADTSAWPATLSITPEDITFEPAAPVQGQTTHIGATVRAQGSTFTYVTVMVYDGDPRRGGKFIGGDLVYLIAAGATATVDIPWITADVWGQHDIWVVIGHQVDEEDISTDNRTHKTIDLPYYHLYLPLGLKSGS